jgi:hypothetical protein
MSDSFQPLNLPQGTWRGSLFGAKSFKNRALVLYNISEQVLKARSL